VRLGVRNSETTDQAKDGGKKSLEVSSAREKVKVTEEPKARGEEVSGTIIRGTPKTPNLSW
jgi:hypothetical protein